MKSLLVDVLREAQDDAPAEVQAPATDAERTGKPDAAPAETAQVDDLDLMATGQFERAEDVGSEMPVVAPEIPGNDPEPVPDAGVSSEPGPLANTTALRGIGAKRQTPTSVVTRIGRLAPVLCLVAVFGVAGGYLIVDKMASGSLNEDLDELSEIVQVDNPDDTTEQNRTTVNIFGAPFAVADTVQPAATAEQQSQIVHQQIPEATSGISQRSSRGETAEVRRTTTVTTAVEDDAFELVASGYAAYRQRDFEVAERLYGKALSVEPNHRDALLGMAAIYQQTARDSRALAAYQKVLQVEPGNAVAAAAILSAGAADSRVNTESDIKLLLQRFPDAHHFHFTLGSIYVGEQRWADARRSFMSAYQLAPANASYSYNLAVSSERLGDLVDAVRYYEEALAYATEGSNVDRSAIEVHLSQLAIIARDDR